MSLSEQAQDQVMKAQGYAVEIEWVLREIFGCDRYGFGGQVNSDEIRKHPFLSMTQGLAFLYAQETERRSQFDRFIENFSLDDLLSFDTNEKTIGDITFELTKKNGLEEVEYIISAFKEAIN